MELAQLSAAVGVRSASPFATFDPHMDCIRVIVRDCSTFERRMTDWITLVYDNYPEDEQSALVGVVIKGFHHLLRQLELPEKGVVRVTIILDRLVKKFPDATVADLAQTEMDRLIKILAETEVTVNLDNQLAYAA